MLGTSLGWDKSGTSVTIIKCVVKTIFKWNVMDILRCKPYTDKKHFIFFGH